MRTPAGTECRSDGRFLRANSSNSPRCFGHRSAVAGCGRGDVNLPAEFLQPDQGAGAEELGVVGMGHERQGDSSFQLVH